MFSPTAIAETRDLDTNNDGILDNLPAGAVLLDGVGFATNPTADRAYGADIMGIPDPMNPALRLPPNAATRFLGDLTPLSAAAWFFGALTGASSTLVYNPALSSANLPAGALLTPGAPNAAVSLVQFSGVPYSVNEGGGSATITVTRTGDTSSTVTVVLATSDGTATTADNDYTAVSTTLTFLPNETLQTATVAINNDAQAEANETINLALSGLTSTGNAQLGTPSTAVLTIIDNDVAMPGHSSCKPPPSALWRAAAA